jgi:HlyD family secretion protein
VKNGDKTWLKRGLWILVAVVVVAGFVYLWWPAPVTVDVGDVDRGELTVTIDEDGRTRVVERYTIAATTTGTLARIELRAGETVEAGEVLATIAPVEAPLLDRRTRAQAEAQVESARAAVAQAQAAVAQAAQAYGFARAEAERLAELHGAGVATSQAVEQADFEVQTAAAQVEAARAARRVAEHQLAQARAAVAADAETEVSGQPVNVSIEAPIDATVLQVFQESGGPIQAGAPLLDLGDPGRLEIVVDVLTTQAVDIEPGAHAIIERWGAGQSVPAVVRHIEPAAFTRLSSLGVEEQRVNVILDVVEATESWEAIGDGYRVEARIVTWHDVDVLKVDASAVFRSPDGWAVFRVVDGRAILTPVEVGARTDREVQILEGLDEGEVVILYPGDAVVDGGRVEPRT